MAVWALLKETGVNWSNHKDARLGAALAYYSVFSIGPLIIIAIAIAGLAFGDDAVRGEVGTQLRGLLGDAGAEGVNAMLAGASKPREGMFATAFGIATLLFAAIGVVVQLKDALNTVWEVPDSKVSGIWNFMRAYLVSLAGVLSLGFLLLVSLLFTTVLAAGAKYIEPWLPEAAMQVAGFVVSFAFITLLFAMMFKWLPDTVVAWRDVWLGAAVTAMLFEIGKFLIGFYIGKQGLESTFGAAASLVVLLIWVYYSSQIVLMGAEFTRAYALRYGSLRHRQVQASDVQASDVQASAARASSVGSPALPAAARTSERPTDPLQAAVRTSPYATALLAVLAGWLLARLRPTSGGVPGAAGLSSRSRYSRRPSADFI